MVNSKQHQQCMRGMACNTCSSSGAASEASRASLAAPYSICSCTHSTSKVPTNITDQQHHRHRLGDWKQLVALLLPLLAGKPGVTNTLLQIEVLTLIQQTMLHYSAGDTDHKMYTTCQTQCNCACLARVSTTTRVTTTTTTQGNCADSQLPCHPFSSCSSLVADAAAHTNAATSLVAEAVAHTSQEQSYFPQPFCTKPWRECKTPKAVHCCTMC